MDITSTMLHLAPGELDAGRPTAPAAAASAQAAVVAAKGSGAVSGTSGGNDEPAAAPTRQMPVPNRVELDIDKPTRRVVGRFVNSQTGDVVRQVPSEEMLRLLAKTRELIGTLFDETA